MRRGRWRELLGDRRGASAIEYGLKAALVAVAIVFSLQGVSCSLQRTFAKVDRALSSS